MVASVASDAEGRTMRSETLDGMGLWGGGDRDKQIKVIRVFGPEAGTDLHWQSDSKTATVIPMPRPGAMGSGPVHFSSAEAGGVVSSGKFDAEGVFEDGAMPPPPGPDTVFVGEMHTEYHKAGAASSNETTEQLCTRMVEGLEPVGTRAKQVLPSGTTANATAL